MPQPFQEPELPPHLRAFDDTDTTRDLIYENTMSALQRRFPVSDGKHRLELTDLRYSGAKTFPLVNQKKALMGNRSLRTPITGKWRLVDEESGNILDEKEDIVMHVPYYTQRGTMISRGNEYTLVNQARLKPGVYSRTKLSGEHEAYFNVKPGTGRTFRMWMEPATGIFRVNVGQANIPAYPLMKIMGIKDEQLEKTWGAEVLAANMQKVDKQALNKLYTRFAGTKAEVGLTDSEKENYLRENLATYEFDPSVVQRTMGLSDTGTVTPNLMLRSTQKLLNISRKEEETDDREAPEFANVLSAEDFIEERIDKDAGRTTKELLWKLRRDRNLGRMPRGALNNYWDSLMLGSGLAAPLEETNPIQILDQQNRIVKTGEGGIRSAEEVIDEARDVNVGQLGFIDLVSGPESEKVGIDVRAAYRTYKGRDKQLYGEFTDRTGESVFLRPEDMADKIVAFPGHTATKPNDELYAVQKGKVIKTKLSDVDAFIPSHNHMFGAGPNLVPMPTGYMPGRAFYSSKYWSQYLPMVKGEVPMVQSQVPGSDMSFGEYYGRKIGSVLSKTDGTVVRVGKNNMTIRGDDGKKYVVELIKDFPFNRMTAISYFPTVKAGDTIKAGQMIANSNFTDKDTGGLNLGVNLKTAIVPYRGFSFEDAYVVSESAAKKLSTERLYGFDKEARQGTEVGRNRFISAFPKKYTKEQIESIGGDGVAKQGTIVRKGDPIVLAVGPKVLSSADADLGKLHKSMRRGT
jgi:DNA-directed RNA polymerase beta subunit